MATKEINHESTSLQQLRDKVDWLKTSVQLANATLRISNRYTNCAANREQLLYENFELDKKNYDKLNQPIKQYNQLQKFVQRKQIHSAIGQLYEFFTNYLREIIEEIRKYHPQKMLTLLNDEQCSNITLNMAQIKGLSSINDIQKCVLELYFDKLQNTQHTQDLYNKIVSHAGLTINSSIKWRGLGYMTFRNLLVHGKGVVSEDFEQRYKGIINEAYRDKIVVGHELPLEMEILNDACNAVVNLCKSIDKQLIEKDLIKSRLVK